MKHYVFLINKNIPKKEELEFEGENTYDDLVFISLKDTKKIKEYLLQFDENISYDYFVHEDIIKSKNILYSFNRYYKSSSRYCQSGYYTSYVSESSYITERISHLESFSSSDIEYYTEEEKAIPNNNGKINIYSNKDNIHNELLNIIKIEQNDILKCYREELDYDHEYSKGYFYYLFDNELYKFDITKSYLYKEKCVANKVNYLEKSDKRNIANNIRINKCFVVYLIDSDEIDINTNMKYTFIKVKDETEMFRSITNLSMTFCYSVYFVIENNDTICMKWKLMNFRTSRLVKNIEDAININIYSDKEIEGYNTIIASSSLNAYKIEMHKSHFKRNGYLLYVKDGVVTRLSILRTNRRQTILQGDLKDIIEETTRFDWEFPSYR